MFRNEANAHAVAPPLPPMRAPLPTVPCDLSEYAIAETGPLSWSAIYEERPRALVLDDPFDLE
jgi:hypothetical protein